MTHGATMPCTAPYGPWVLGLRHTICPMTHGEKVAERCVYVATSPLLLPRKVSSLKRVCRRWSSPLGGFACTLIPTEQREAPHLRPSRFRANTTLLLFLYFHNSISYVSNQSSPKQESSNTHPSRVTSSSSAGGLARPPHFVAGM